MSYTKQELEQKLKFKKLDGWEYKGERNVISQQIFFAQDCTPMHDEFECETPLFIAKDMFVYKEESELKWVRIPLNEIMTFLQNVDPTFEFYFQLAEGDGTSENWSFQVLDIDAVVRGQVFFVPYFTSPPF